MAMTDEAEPTLKINQGTVKNSQSCTLEQPIVETRPARLEEEVLVVVEVAAAGIDLEGIDTMTDKQHTQNKETETCCGRAQIS